MTKQALRTKDARLAGIGRRNVFTAIASWGKQFTGEAVNTSSIASRIILVAVVASGGVFRLWQINSMGLNTDEAVYAGQAAGIIGDPTLKPFFPVFRAHPMLFQFIVSFGFRWGVNDLVGRLFSVAIGLATIYLVYFLGTLLYGRGAGLFAALFIALMPYHIIVTRQMLLDGPMTFSATLTLYFVARFAVTSRPQWLYATGVGLGLTFLTKETGFIVIGAIYAFLALCSQIRVRLRDLMLSFVFMLLVMATYPLSLALAGGGGAQKAQSYLVWQLFRRPNHDWTFYPLTVPPAIGPLVIIAALLGLWLLRRERSWREVLLGAWVLVPALFFQIWPVKGFQYLLPIAPALAVLAGRTISRWPAINLRIGTQRTVTVSMRMLAAGVMALSLLLPAWQRIQPAQSDEFLAGSGGVPGGREAGLWINDNVPENALILTVGPSMANILQFYGHRKAYGLSVSPNPLHRNPSYEAVRNPDNSIRNGELQYLVYDTFSASRSSFFGNALLRYAERYNGRIVHTESIMVTQPDGTTVAKPVITIYEVRP